MKLTDIVSRTPPEPWAEGDNFPWDEPGFSRRMLAEHLCQEHDLASRRSGWIDRHTAWIHTRLLGEKPSKILDLACGPGLYAGRLARLGHDVLGIDFSPASIDYARAEADRQGLSVRYQLEDIRRADYGQGYHLAMLLYGEFNVFHPHDARFLLEKAHRALLPGGALLLEPSTLEHIRAEGQDPSSWYASAGGLFSPVPHVVLSEAAWDEQARVTTRRYYVVDAQTTAVQRFAASYQAYSQDDLAGMLGQQGFEGVTFFPGLGEVDEGLGLFAAAARRP